MNRPMDDIEWSRVVFNVSTSVAPEVVRGRFKIRVRADGYEVSDSVVGDRRLLPSAAHARIWAGFRARQSAEGVRR